MSAAGRKRAVITKLMNENLCLFDNGEVDNSIECEELMRCVAEKVSVLFANTRAETKELTSTVKVKTNRVARDSLQSPFTLFSAPIKWLRRRRRRRKNV